MAAAGFESLDFDQFHTVELPRRLAGGHGALAARAARRLGPLAFRLPEGSAYTYRPTPDAIEVVAGDEAAETVIELRYECWEGLVHDYESAPGLLYGGKLACRRGRAMTLVAWEPALRAMFTGRPPFDPATADLRDLRGAPLDGEHAFEPTDDREEMAHFLRTAGYLFVRQLFPAEAIAALRREAEELRCEAVRGDRLSWWGRNAKGEEVLCRVTRAAAKPRLATIPQHAGLRALVDLADETLVHRSRGSPEEGVTVIYKNPDMTEGLSDLPWHRDCGMGGHAVMCPVLLASVFLTDATPETGELVLLPGSWRGTVPYMDPRSRSAPRGAHFAARPGDVSLHYGDVMHAAPPPARSDLPVYRMSAVTAFVRPEARNHRDARSYNDVLHQRDDGQIEHLAVVAKRR